MGGNSNTGSAEFLQTPVQLDMISDDPSYMADEQVMVGSIGEQATQRLKAEGHLEHWLGEAMAFDGYRSSIEINLQTNDRLL